MIIFHISACYFFIYHQFLSIFGRNKEKVYTSESLDYIKEILLLYDLSSYPPI